MLAFVASICAEFDSLRGSEIGRNSVPLASSGSFFQISNFEDSTCQRVGYEETFRADTCFPTVESSEYVKGTIVANADVYGRILSYYSDPSCSTSFRSPERDISVIPKDKCEDKVKNVLVKNYVLKNRQETGVTFTFYPDQTSCLTFNSTKLKSTSYVRYGYCLQQWSDDNYDVKFTGCKEGVVTWTRFSSTDGQCTGAETHGKYTCDHVCQAAIPGPLGSPSWMNAYCP